MSLLYILHILYNCSNTHNILIIFLNIPRTQLLITIEYNCRRFTQYVHENIIGQWFLFYVFVMLDPLEYSAGAGLAYLLQSFVQIVEVQLNFTLSCSRQL
jgi:hypothetical protein